MLFNCVSFVLCVPLLKVDVFCVRNAVYEYDLYAGGLHKNLVLYCSEEILFPLYLWIISYENDIYLLV